MRIQICRAVREDADNGRYLTYGLQMGEVRVDDISTHRYTVARLRWKLLWNRVSSVHFLDAVEDFLCTS